jgi:ferric-dicitrate binding protein FerR (iron transport regulator)
MDDEYKDIQEALHDMRLRDEVCPDRESIWNNISSGIQGAGKTVVRTMHRPLAWSVAAAACIVIAVGCSVALATSGKTYSAEDGAIAIELPDHSSVEIDSASSLHVNRASFALSRRVKLDGGARFSGNHKAGLKVKTGNSLTKVLGTTFRVVENSEEIVVTCESGSLSVKTDAGKNVIGGGQKLLYRNGKVSIGPIVEPLPPFVDFDNESITSVLARISKIYEKDIEGIDGIKDSSSLTFSGRVTTSDMDEALAIVSLACGIDFGTDEEGGIYIK